MNCINIKLKFSSKNLDYLINLLSSTGKSSRLIGGCIRDSLLNFPVTDIDIATALLPHEVIDLFQMNNIRFVKPGFSHGTITALFENEQFEITTLRRDIECYGREAKVEYTESFEEDALRRDFTINALSYNFHEEKIYDYVGGLKDIKNSQVIFIGEANQRIKEDYLRILRFFRFSAKYSNKLDEEGYKACVKLKNGIKQLSYERITSELDKILLLPNCLYVIEEMNKGNVFQEIDSRIQVDIHSLSKGLLSEVEFKILPTLSLKYALLLNQVSTNLPSILSDLRMSKKIIKEILNLTSATPSHPYSLYDIWFHDPKVFEQKILYLYSTKQINYDEVITIYKKLQCKLPSCFPIDGNQLLSIGIQGKEIKKMLDILRYYWIEKNFKVSKEELINYALNNQNYNKNI